MYHVLPKMIITDLESKFDALAFDEKSITNASSTVAHHLSNMLRLESIDPMEN
jgi:hypothetical protein